MLRTLTFSALLILVLPVVVPDFAYADYISSMEFQAPGSSAAAGAATNETPSLWFVELSSAPTADGASPSVIAAEQRAFRANAKSAGLAYTERRAFSALWNGLSVQIDPSQLAKLSRIAGVKNVYPIDVIRIPETTPSNPELWTALAMIGADVAQSELGFTGKGVKVGVMDTGIDYDHKALGGDGVARSNSSKFPNSRVIAGYDFVGDAYNAEGNEAAQTPHPDGFPDDCAGHGSHVAGIIGANDSNGLKGVAPKVSLGSYRVFGCGGSTTADIMIAAMERALADGMQVLNMSIGSAYQWPQYPTAMAATRLVNKGMVVVASIGNDAASGLYSAGVPGLGEKVIGVASYDNTHIYLPYFTVNSRNIGYMTLEFSPVPPTSGAAEIVNVGLACDPLPAGSLAGKVALAARGTCTFAQKATNAITAGANAVLISNNASGVFSGTLGGPLPIPKPVAAISLADGNFIRAQAAPVNMTWTDKQGPSPKPTGKLISSFSSYGLSPDLALKPDIGAPGGDIYSTYPLEKGGYATLSGTSMASPHVAGAAALYLQAHPHALSQAMRGILQNSAEPQPWSGNPGLGLLDNVHRQGAGMLRIDSAILATTKISPAKISAGEGEAGPFTQALTIENKAAAAVTYDLSYVTALSTGGVITPALFTSNASVAFSVSSITVPAGSTAGVTATITPATGPTYGQYGGYIIFTPQGDGQVYRVPFAGFVGDYQGIQVLAPTKYGFPWLSYLNNNAFAKLTSPSDWTFTMQGSDVPFFLVHFDHQSRLFRIEIYSQQGKAWHRAYNEEYMPRNTSTVGFYAMPFDGYTFSGNRFYVVPDGTYYAVISVLKANGDAGNPAHWETWTSPNFVIDRPEI